MNAQQAGNDAKLDSALDDMFPASDPPSTTSPVVGVGTPARSRPLLDGAVPSFGFALSSEECAPLALVHQAVLAEQAGFDFVSISDHFHPWLPAQGNSAFVWTVLGAIASATSRITVGTGVTCPILRIHPAIVAHAAATAGVMLEGRFFLGLGTGEALNELVTGQRWPSAAERLDRLEEAIAIIRELLTGDETTVDGRYFTVSQARLFTSPEVAPPILVASSSPGSARLAAANDGLITTGPDRELFEAFDRAGGRGKPRIGQITVCWDEDEHAARATAARIWPTSVLSWKTKATISTPEIFEDITSNVDQDAVAKHILCGPGLEPILERAAAYVSAGFSHIYFHQVGSRQEEFLTVCRDVLLPELNRTA